jgi:hypothetical protein
MGLFRRRQAAADPVSPGDTATPVQRAALSGPPAWASLPPLAPTVGVPGSTFKIGAAVKPDLVALASPRLATGMGHLVSADGPPGVVAGLATVGVQRSADGAGGGGLPSPAMPLPPRAEPVSGNGHAPGDAVAPAGGPALLVPRIVPGDGWSPPASPLIAPVEVDAPTRHLPLVPAPVQRRAEATADPAPGADRAPEPAVPPAEVDAVEPPEPEPDAPAPGPGPVVPQPTAGPGPDAGPTAPTAGPPTIQRSAARGAADEAPAATAPVVPVTVERPAGPVGGKDVAAAGTLPLPTTVWRSAADDVPPTASPADPVTVPRSAGPAANDMPAATTPAGPTNVQRSGDGPPDGPPAGVAATVVPVQAPDPLVHPPRPRPGSLGPPIESSPRPVGGLPLAPPVQRSVAAPPATAPAVPAVTPVADVSDLAIRARPRPGAVAPVTVEVPSVLLQRTGDDAPGESDPGAVDTPAPSPLLDLAPDATGVAAAPVVPGPATAAPADPVVQRQAEAPPVVRPAPRPAEPLAAPAPARAPTAAVAVQRSGSGGPTVLLDRLPLAAPATTTTGVVQRWPDLGSVRDAALGRARETLGNGARSLVRSLPGAGSLPDGDGLPARPSMPGLPSMLGLPPMPSVPDLPSTPGLPSIPPVPGLPPMPSLPGLPSVPGLPDMPLAPPLPSLPDAPSLPGLPDIPGAPALPQLPEVPQLPGAPAAPGVPTTEITFPPPATPAAAPAPAGAGGATAGNAGGDLDELAHKLYDRIRWRLRAELRLDMERSGLGAGLHR